jgi:transposase-like protein
VTWGSIDGTLGNWVNSWRREHVEPQRGTSLTEQARVKEMEEETRRLRMDNEFLKEAAAFFARTHP